MKIMVMSDKYPPYYEGGYELNCEVTVQGLLRKGHQVFVLTSSYGVEQPITDRNVFRLMQPLANSSQSRFAVRCNNLRNAWLGRRNYSIAKQTIDKVKPDIVYVWRMGGVSLFPLWAAHKAGLPIVYELGDYWLAEYKRNYILEPNPLKKLYRGMLLGGYTLAKLEFKYLFAVSEALKKHYVENEFEAASIVVKPRGVPADSINDADGNNDRECREETRLLYAGRIVAVKGVHIAIEAVGHLIRHHNHGNIFLDIVGDGDADYIRSLKELIKEHNIENHVRFIKQIPRDELLDTYKNYDMVLFTSTWEEPLGNTIIEAMAKGVPVIASDVGGVPEIIEDGRNGLLVPPNDYLALALAIKRMADDRSLAAALRKAGIATVRKKFTNDRLIDMTDKFLSEVVLTEQKNSWPL